MPRPTTVCLNCRGTGYQTVGEEPVPCEVCQEAGVVPINPMLDLFDKIKTIDDIMDKVNDIKEKVDEIKAIVSA